MRIYGHKNIRNGTANAKNQSCEQRLSLKLIYKCEQHLKAGRSRCLFGSGSAFLFGAFLVLIVRLFELGEAALDARALALGRVVQVVAHLHVQYNECAMQ